MRTNDLCNSPGVCLHTLGGHDDYVASVVFSNDGKRLASGSDDTTVKIWDSTSGTCLQTLEGHDDWVTLVVFSNDGYRLASGSWDKTIKIWDATSGAYLRTFEGHDAGVGSLVFSNDRQRLASGSHDKTAKIWGATSGTCLHTLEAHDQEVTSLVFSNDGRRLASASMGTTVKIWDLDSGVCQDTVLLGQKIPFSLDPFNYSYYPLNVGLLDLDLFTSSGNSPPTNKTHSFQTNLPRRSFNIDGAWVMEGEKRLFWLPPGYRPINLHALEEGTVSQIRVALCTPSNHISILGFRFNGWHGEAS